MIRTTLFSVIVITYNSADFILETLDSIRGQEYEGLELIISDDYSSDATLTLCRQWLEQNKGRFVRSEILAAKKNQGIPANCNRGLKAAKGDWIKFIAGDDAFFSGTFENAAVFIAENPDARIFASSFATFEGNLSAHSQVAERDDSLLPFYRLTARRQHFMLVRNNYVHAGTVFLQRSLLVHLGGFNEKYRLLEDHPMWLTITANKERIFYMPSYTLKYRLHLSAVFSHTSAEKLFNNFYLKRRRFELDMIYPALKWYEKLSYQYVFYLKQGFDALKLNRDTTFCRFLYRFLIACAPVALIKLFKRKHLSKSL